MVVSGVEHMEEPIKAIVPTENETPLALQEQEATAVEAPEPFRTPHSRDYPVLGYE